MRTTLSTLFTALLLTTANAAAQSEVAVVWNLPTGSQPPRSVAVSDSGITYILLSGGVVQAIDLDGDLLWTHQAPTNSSDLAVHSAGGVSIVGSISESDPLIPDPLGAVDGFFQTLAADGTPLGAQRIGGAGFDGLTAVAATGLDLVFSGTSTSANFGAPGTVEGPVFGRIDGSGALVWVTRLPVASPNSATLEDIAVRPDGSGHAVGSFFINGSFSTQRLIVHFDAAGALQESIGQTGVWVDADHLPTGDLVVSGNSYGGTGFLGFGCKITGSQWCITMREGIGGLQSAVHTGVVFGGDVIFGATQAGFPGSTPERTGLVRVDAVTGAASPFLDIRLDMAALAIAGDAEIDPRGGIRTTYRNVDFTEVGVLRIAPLDPFEAQVCAGQANSTGSPAVLGAAGSPQLAADELTLFVNGAPPQQTTLFLASRTGGFTPGAGGSQGNLCLGGSIGRFSGPGEIRVSSAQGRAALHVNLAQLPEGGASSAAMAGETWNFQAWYRDVNPGPTSNFSSAVAVTFQ